MVSRNLPASTTLAFLPNSRFGTQEGANAEKQIPGRLSAQVDIRCVQVGTRGRVDGFYKKLSESNGSTITVQFRTIGWNKKKENRRITIFKQMPRRTYSLSASSRRIGPGSPGSVPIMSLFRLRHTPPICVFFFGSGLSLAVIFQRGTLRGDR